MLLPSSVLIFFKVQGMPWSEMCLHSGKVRYILGRGRKGNDYYKKMCGKTFLKC